MNTKLKAKTYQEFMKAMDDMFEKFMSLSEIEKGKLIVHNKVLHALLDGKYKRFDDYFQKGFDPMKAGFELMKAGDKYGTENGAGSNKRECWTDGDCVLIDLTMIDYGDVGKPQHKDYLEFVDAVNA